MKAMLGMMMLLVASLKAEQRMVFETKFAFAVVGQTMPAGRYEMRQMNSTGTAMIVTAMASQAKQMVLFANRSSAEPTARSVVKFVCPAGGGCTLDQVMLEGGSMWFGGAGRKARGTIVAVDLRKLAGD
jgi:hypothetical protein